MAVGRGARRETQGGRAPCAEEKDAASCSKGAIGEGGAGLGAPCTQGNSRGEKKLVHGCCAVEAVGHGRQRARREVELSSLLHAVWKKTGRKRRRWRLGGR